MAPIQNPDAYNRLASFKVYFLIQRCETVWRGCNKVRLLGSSAIIVLYDVTHTWLCLGFHSRVSSCVAKWVINLIDHFILIRPIGVICMLIKSINFIRVLIDNTDIQPKISIDEISLLWLFCGCWTRIWY